MSKVVLTNIDLSKNQLQNAVIQPLASDPENPVVGQIYFNSTTGLLKAYNGEGWEAVGAVLSVNGYTGAVVLTQDDVGNGSTYVRTHNDLTDSLKGLINGALQKSGGTMTGDIAMGSNKVTGLGTPSSDADAATKKYVDDLIAGLGNALQFKGVVNQASDLPDTHSIGWVYKVGTAGTYVGQTCEVGDTIICVASGTVAANADWYVLQANIDGAVTGPASSSNNDFAFFDGTSGKVIKDNAYSMLGLNEYIPYNDDTAPARKVPSAKHVQDFLMNFVHKTTTVLTGNETSATVTIEERATVLNAFAEINGEMVMVDIEEEDIHDQEDDTYSTEVTFTIANPLPQNTSMACTVVWLRLYHQ